MASIKIRRESVRWLLLEGTAIVVSILLAFSIEAWWQSSREREDRRTVLTSLLAELETAQRNFEIYDPFFEAIQDSARQLVVEGLAAERSLTDAEIDQLLWDVTFYAQDAQLRTPMVSVIAGGDSTLVSNIEIRVLLGSWNASYELWKTAIMNDYRFWSDHLRPYLVRRTSLPQIYTASDHEPGTPGSTFPTEDFLVRTPVSHSELLRDPEFLNIMAERVNLLTNVLDWRPENLKSDLDVIISKVRQELGN